MGETTISGYAALFGVETVIEGFFRERIARGAFAATITRDDIRSAFNHDLNQLLGRKSAGTVTFIEDTKGLRYAITVNASDPNALSVAAKIARRDVTEARSGSSRSQTMTNNGSAAQRASFRCARC